MQILLEKFIEMENLKVEWIIDFKAHIYNSSIHKFCISGLTPSKKDVARQEVHLKEIIQMLKENALEGTTTIVEPSKPSHLGLL